MFGVSDPSVSSEQRENADMIGLGQAHMKMQVSKRLASSSPRKRPKGPILRRQLDLLEKLNLGYQILYSYLTDAPGVKKTG